ncbi:MAG: SAM-dependent chlorinase/fluorinase [Chloroflexi bacterium]|nr:SAM-dependent chlorinase/fluorinase [Chloroflexota bacterium]
MGQQPIITLLTDFGADDGYVGAMKGVMLGILPNVNLIDVSHTIRPQNVRQAAYVLSSIYPYFPPGTVHLVVVDPGVGSDRRPIAVRVPGACLVGPDNGVLSYIMSSEPVHDVFELAHPRYRLHPVSDTFHGRDVFAPAAAYLAAGVEIAALGPRVVDPMRLPAPRLALDGNVVHGEVLHIDRFGNGVTSIGRLVWEGLDLLLRPSFGAVVDASVRIPSAAAQVAVASQILQGVHRIYAEVAPGEGIALVGSDGYLEIAVREGDGAAVLGLELGDSVTLSF